MKRLIALSLLALAGCKGTTSSPSWEITDLKIERDSLNYATITGKITQKATLAGFAPTADVTFYQDAYSTMILVDSSTIGGDIKNKGDSQAFKLSHYKVWTLPSSGGYKKVCATIKVKDTNYADASQVGCLE